MPASESRRDRSSLITGAACPNCGRNKSRKTSDRTGERELKCRFCGHRWVPEREI